MAIFRRLLAIPLLTLRCATGLFAACDGDPIPPDNDDPLGIVTIDTLTRFQIMTGWEAHTQSGEANPLFREFRDALFDQAVKEVGINRLRVEIRSGAENPVEFTLADNDRCKRWDSVNDNDDPRLINPAGFHFSEVDSTIARVVLPMKQRLEARGERCS